MKNKRIALMTAAAAIAVTACLFLITALGSTQSLASPLAPEQLSAVVSVTFPSGPWPSYAHQAIWANPEPPEPRHPTELCAVVINQHPTNAFTATLEFGVAEFGIGMDYAPVGQVDVELPQGGESVGCIAWIPPHPSRWGIQARLIVDEFEDQIIQRNLDVDEPLQANTPHARSFIVRNPSPTKTVTVTLGLVSPSPGWGTDLSKDILTNLEPGAQETVTLTVTPPASLPPGIEPIVDVEGHIDGEPIGGFRKIFRPPVILHRFPEPFYAESEISVHPYPPRIGEPTEICAELYNWTEDTQMATVYFSWAFFGIGLEFYPINGPRIVTLPPKSLVRECIHWIPPVDGQMCFQVELEMDNYTTQLSQRNIDMDEPLEPGVGHSRPFPVVNPFTDPMTITLGLVPYLPGWDLELSQDTLPNALPGVEQVVTLTVTPPADLPPDEHPIVDVEAFINNEIIGGFRKIFRPPVPLHRPQDPVYAESEIFVHPYPPRAREPTEVGAEIRNPTDDPQFITVTFSFAPFGIGLDFMIINEPITVTVPPHGLIHPATIWIPPDDNLWCFMVQIEIPGHDEIYWSQRNIDIDEPLEPNTPHLRPFIVRNNRDYTATISLGLIPHFPDWGLELSQDVLPDVGPGAERVVHLIVTPPDDLPGDGDPIVDVEAYIEGELIGGFRKIFRPPVPVHRPKDPIYAESEIGIDPYPSLPGQPVELSVEVHNPTNQDRVVSATFSVASFGIGLPFTTTNIMPNPIAIFVPAQGAARGHVIWNPPQYPGKFCVQVTLEMPGQEPLWSRRNIDVGEPLSPTVGHSLLFEVGAHEFTQTVTATIGLISHREGWSMSLSDNILVINPDEVKPITLTVTPSIDAELGTGMPIVDVEAFVEGQLIGGFRKLDIPPIPIHKPHEKGYAESEIIIHPYPPNLGQTTWISTVVQNNSDVPMTVDLEFGWAQFGMGIPFSTTGVTSPTQSVTLGPSMTQTVGTAWIPQHSGHQCVRILLSDPSGRFEDQESQRNVDVVEQAYCGTNIFTFTVYNDSPFTATVDIGMITFNVPTHWQVSVTPSGTIELEPYSEATIMVIVKIPCQAGSPASDIPQTLDILAEETGNGPTVDVEGYIDGELVGGIELQFPRSQAVWPNTTHLPLIIKNH